MALQSINQTDNNFIKNIMEILNIQLWAIHSVRATPNQIASPRLIKVKTSPHTIQQPMRQPKRQTSGNFSK